MTEIAVVVLAGGQGTRMRSQTPKVLHDLCGIPLVLWPVRAALEAGAARVVVVGGPDREIAPVLPPSVALAVQQEPLGTAHAVAAAAAELEGATTVVVLSGDVPLIESDTVAGLVAAHEQAGAAATMLTMELDDPGAYGRVVRGADGAVERVVETKRPGDATPEQLLIREVNSGVFAFDCALLLDALRRLLAAPPDNAQGEWYLPDVLQLLRADGAVVAAHLADDAALALGVNNRADLATVAELAQLRIQRRLMLDGVTIVAPGQTTVDVDVRAGADTVLEPGVVLRGATRVGAGCRIGPGSTLIDADVADGATILHSYLVDCEVHERATVGPFAYLRPGAVLRAGSKIGTFVEVKNSDIGEGAKIPHLSYIGDADVGERSNLGAGTITANYDGRAKHRTTIGSGVRGGVDTSFVAPVSVGDDAYTAAGSVITEDVPPGALGVGRARQRNVEGYADRVGDDA